MCVNRESSYFQFKDKHYQSAIYRLDAVFLIGIEDAPDNCRHIDEANDQYQCVIAKSSVYVRDRSNQQFSPHLTQALG